MRFPTGAVLLGLTTLLSPGADAQVAPAYPTKPVRS